MAIPAAALELELENVERGAPTLARAYVMLRNQWQSGDRERELALHLAFLAWYLMLEPPHLTGFAPTDVPAGELARMFNEAHEALLPRGAHENDAEALYVVGLMAALSPWLLGPDAEWTARSVAYRTRYCELAPSGIAPEVFEGRGAYGHYFRGHATLKNAY